MKDCKSKIKKYESIHFNHLSDSISNKSVQISPDNSRFVWLADGDTAKRRFITVSSLSDYGVVVENGLSEGDKLIVEGFQKISEGMKISIK